MERDRLVQAVCDAAADLIERDGWVRFAYRTVHGRCLNGAVDDQWSRFGVEAVVAARCRLVDELKHRGCGVSGIPARVILASWNDRSDRTKEQVVDFLRTGRLQ